MKKFNFNLARLIILNAQNLLDASLGMHEDWFWTAEKAWDNKDGFNEQLFKDKEVGGINGSNWANPVLQLNFNDGSTQVFECFIFEGIEVCPLEKALKSAQCTRGVMSSPVQDWRFTLDVMKPAILN